MLSKKRGQVTVFIGLGVVLAVALIFAIAFRGEISKIVTESESEQQTNFASQVEEVQKHVEGCLSNALSESIVLLASKKLEDYDKSLGEETKLKFSMCLNLGSFDEIAIKQLEDPELEVQRNSDNTVITATLTMPLNIEKDGDEQQLTEFVAQEKLKRKMCVLKEMLDSDCRAKQDLKVGIFTFQEGEEVAIGGECLAC